MPLSSDLVWYSARRPEIAELSTIPWKNQLTYSGDPVVISCFATPLQPETEVILLWVKNGSPVNNSFESVQVKRSRTSTNELRAWVSAYKPSMKALNFGSLFKSKPRSYLYDSDVEISRLSSVHDGEWLCVANSSFGIETRELSLRVVSERTAWCKDTCESTCIIEFFFSSFVNLATNFKPKVVDTGLLKIFWIKICWLTKIFW